MKRCHYCQMPFFEWDQKNPWLCKICARNGKPPNEAARNANALAIASRTLGEAPEDPFEGEDL